MKHIVIDTYKDLALKRYLTKGSVLEEEYKKDKVELTKERIDYLVDKKICTSVEKTEDNNKEKKQEATKEPESKKKIEQEENKAKNTKKNEEK